MQPQNETDVKLLPKIATRIRGVDDVLDGGLPAGRMSIVSGGPGAGKTVFALEFLYRGALSGEPGVFVTFEESEEALRTNAHALGWNLATLEQSGVLSIMHARLPHDIFTSGVFEIQGLLAILDGMVQSTGAKRIVLDAVDVILRLFREEGRKQAELKLLQDWLGERGLTSIVTLKTNEDRTLYPFIDYMADCVLFLDQRIDNQVRTRRIRVLKYRGSGFLSNEHPFIISGTGFRIMPVSATLLVPCVRGGKVSSGSLQLDGFLGGGLHQGSCILVSGPSGVGKTTLASVFVREACRRKEKVLYVNYEQTAEAMLSEMLGPGIELRPYIENDMLRIVPVMPESMGAQEHLAHLLDYIEGFSPRHIIIDAVSACSRMGSENAAYDFLVYLLTVCKQQNITCVFINQQRGGVEQLYELSGFALSSLTDTLIGLNYIQQEGDLYRQLLVLKSRGSSHSMRYHRMVISDRGIHFTDPPSEGSRIEQNPQAEPNES